MRKIIIALSVFVGMATGAKAQIIYSLQGQAPADTKATSDKTGIGFGPELGLNMANMAVKNSSTSFKAGLAVGGIVDFGFTKNFYLQPGLFYLMNGCNFSGGSYNLNTIQLPVNVEYKLSKPGGNRLFFGIGPYVGYNISGATKSGGKSTTINIGTDQTKDNIKALDFGAGINVGYQLAMGFFVRAHYQMGFANLAENTSNSNSITTSAIGVTIGYLFGGKPKKA